MAIESKGIEGLRLDKKTVLEIRDKHIEKPKGVSEDAYEFVKYLEESSLGTIESLCESELEKYLGFALYLVCKSEGLFVQVVSPAMYGLLFMREPEELSETDLALARYLQKSDILIMPNMPVNPEGKNYRADFMISYKQKGKKKRKFILIECDSFMYHSTAEQLDKDKKRERTIRKAGFEMLRYSGKEIYGNSMKVAIDIVNHTYYGV